MGFCKHNLGIVPATTLTILLLCVSHGFSQQQSITRETNVNLTEVLDSLLNNYDRRIRPNYETGAPLDVAISMYVLNAESLSENDMEFTLQCYFREHWKDSRLDFSQFSDLDEIRLGSEFSKSIWTPDTFFPNEKRAHHHVVPMPNELIRIKPDGSVTKSVRLTITASCPMNFIFFPMDNQICSLEIESYRFTTNDVLYSWYSSEKMDFSAMLTEFQVFGKTQKSTNIQTTTGNYSRLTYEIMFFRELGYYLTHVYIPACNTVIISWFSFWFGEDAAVTRALFGILSMLALTILVALSNLSGPNISYAKALDVYTGTCFMMIFASLLELAMVNYLFRRIQKRKSNMEIISEQTIKSNPKSIEQVNTKGTQPTVSGKILDKLCGYSPYAIDKKSRIAFPVSFLIFNIFYWIIYLCLAPV